MNFTIKYFYFENHYFVSLNFYKWIVLTSEGPRNCVGQTLGKLTSKLAITLLLRKFRFELDDEQKITGIKQSPRAVVLLPMNGLKFKVFRR